MTVEAQGDSNRVAGRDYYEKNINIAAPQTKEDLRPLVSAQRSQLNQLVKDIAEAGREDVRFVWRRLHAELGVNGIEEITISQYSTALSFLNALHERSRERDANKKLVSQLLRSTEQNELREQLTRFCHINFGTSRLNDLARPQLQQAMGWLDERQGRTTTNTPPPKVQTWQDAVNTLKAEPRIFGAVLAAGIVLGMLLAH
ncbi:membrane protein [Pectobacterium carotovorum]|uniref:membrane protein n=1 Tax=Pectobacterium carotovorum TaxID=554 RepID=UPI00057DE964|nr:membrane protein [Pectobacterium carotovorum]KHT34430.1 membrane protein [Pectobacterium carotovorum subsp. carotovorum]